MFEELKPHLIELRKRLLISALCIIVMFFICLAFNKYILDVLTMPLKTVLLEISKQINFIEMVEPLFTAMRVTFFAGFLLSLPVIFRQLWGFVVPGFYDNEKRLVVPSVIFASVMFILGCVFCYFVVVPFILKFLIDFGASVQNFKSTANIGAYVGFFTKLMITFGLAFEMPVLTYFFAGLGLIDDAFLKRQFRIVVLIIFIFPAMMTLPSVFSQLLLAMPLYGLYGISILIAKKINSSPKNDDV